MAERSPEQIIKEIPDDEFLAMYVIAEKDHYGTYPTPGFHVGSRKIQEQRTDMTSSRGKLTQEGYNRSKHSVRLSRNALLYFDKEGWGHIMLGSNPYTNPYKKLKINLLIKAAQNCEKKYTPKEAARAALLLRGTTRTVGDTDISMQETIAFHEGLREFAKKESNSSTYMSTDNIYAKYVYGLSAVKRKHSITKNDEAALISLGISKKEFLAEIKEIVTKDIKIKDIGSAIGFKKSMEGLFGPHSYIDTHVSIATEILSMQCENHSTY
jgi:hypothetical protein